VTDHLKLLKSLPRVALGKYPTPLDVFADLAVKREDLSDPAFGGNKTRALEYLVGEALAQGAKTLVTMGSRHSNHCRLTAAAAARYGLRCRLLIVDAEPVEPQLKGNRLLSHLLGAEETVIPLATARENIDAELAKLREAGESIYFIPGGGANSVGLLGYIAAGLELVEQIEALSPRDWHLYLACGTGATQAGLLLALALGRREIPVTGVCIARSAERCRREIINLSSEFCRLHAIANPLDATNIDVKDDWIGEGYGVVSPRRLEVITDTARRYALFVDPIYTGRVMEAVNESREDGKTPLFIHTGGLPGLFAENFVEAL
jgi:1-aminocyclopropane-1-carboxylate deaminase/D-cysteine desulfhydrase-like pyridoxal-dependent ACC family enzyme